MLNSEHTGYTSICFNYVLYTCTIHVYMYMYIVYTGIHNTHVCLQSYECIVTCMCKHNLIHTFFQDWAHFFASRLALWPQWPMRLVGPQVGSSGLPRWFLQNRCTAGETRERNICSPCRSITCTLPCWDILTHRFPSGQSSVNIWGHMMHRKANLSFLWKTFIFESEVQSAQLVGNNSAICKRGIGNQIDF